MRRFAGRVAPEDSWLYKFLYFRYTTFKTATKYRRITSLRFAVVITDVCNLNCKACTTFSPLVREPWMCSVEDYERDIRQLSGALGSDGIDVYKIMGGELLLHPDLVRILQVSRKCLPKDKIEVITNGILLHKMDEDFWNCCRENNIGIDITPYPIRLNINRIMELGEKYGVQVGCYSDGTMQANKDNFRKYTLNPGCDISNAKKAWQRCFAKECPTVLRGRIYRCNFPALCGIINDRFDVNFEITESDYLEIGKIKDRKEILDFLYYKYGSFCRYCDVDN